MWDLVPQLGIEPGPPALGAWSLSHWTTREGPLPPGNTHPCHPVAYFPPISLMDLLSPLQAHFKAWAWSASSPTVLCPQAISPMAAAAITTYIPLTPELTALGSSSLLNCLKDTSNLAWPGLTLPGPAHLSFLQSFLC